MGKSTISSMLLKIGIPVFDSDKEVEHILVNNSKIINQINKKWPQAVVINKHEKRINKKKLGDIIFKTLKDKYFLEKLIHPIIQKKRDLFILQNKNKKVVALDVPLLFETNTYKICDYIFIANTKNSTQRHRVLKRPNMTMEKFNLINKHQLSNIERKSLEPKSFIITTSFGKLVTFMVILIILLNVCFFKREEN